MKSMSKLGVLVCLVGLMSVLLADAQSAFKADGLVESTAGGFKFPDGTVQNTSAVPGGPYTLGGTGPGGGFVFHLTADGLHGLEAAPADLGDFTSWGCSGIVIGSRAWGLGEGARNTADIVRGCDSDTTAAALTDRYLSPTGYFDWYLPSRYELSQMYTVLHLNGIGNFDGNYWSSSEGNGEDYVGAWYMYFLNGSATVFAKNAGLRVRAVRAF